MTGSGTQADATCSTPANCHRKDKRAAAAKIEQFAKWLDTFKREDFRQLNTQSLDSLKQILTDITKMLQGLLSIENNEPANAAAEAQNTN